MHTPPFHSLQVAKAVTLVVGGVRAARLLQERLLACVVRLPMGFFDSQPTGRLLNRMTKDVGECDKGWGEMSWLATHNTE